MPSKRRSSAGALMLAASLLLLQLVPTAAPVAAAASSACTSQTNPFSVTAAAWGTSGAPQSVYPGDQNAPLTITMLFSGPCTSPQATFYLSLSSALNPTPFTGANGISQPKVVGLGIAPNTFVTETFYLDVDPKATTGVTYYVPMFVQYANNTASSMITETMSAPVTLEGPVDLSFSPSTSSLVAGETNDVTVAISNSGTAPSGSITTTVSAPSSVTVLNQMADVSSLGAGSNATRVLQMFVPASLSGTAVTLAFTAKYLDAYSNSQTTTQSLGFVVSTPTVQSGTSFVVEGAQWGSSTSSSSPLPGTQDTALVVSLQYLGSTPVTSLKGTVALPTGITDLNGQSSAVAYSSATTSQYGSVQLTFYVDIASAVKPGSYNYTLALDWMTAQSLGLSQTSVVTPPPIAQLQSSFQVQGASWGSASPPIPGSQGVPLVVSLQYLGTTSVTSLEGTLSLPSGITDVNGHPASKAYAASVSANQVVTLSFEVDVSGTLKPGSYNCTLGLSWTTSVGVPLSQSAVVSPPPIEAATTASFPLSVSQTNSTVVAGTTTPASFQLANVGTAAIYSPTFSLSVGAPLVLVSIASPVPTAELDPGKNASFTARVTSSPSAAAGIYSGTLTVSFTDQNGAAHAQSFPVGFTLEGTVTLVLQNTQVTQTTAGFTVTGSVLNEGSVPAYYSSITGAVAGSLAAPVYLGEIDPNTPLPFSITIPFTAPATLTATNSSGALGAGSSSASTSTRVFGAGGPGGNASRTFPRGNFTGFAGGFPGRLNSTGGASITLALSYRDTFGKTQAQPFTLATTVKTASQLSGGTQTVSSSPSSSPAFLVDMAYGAVAAVLATLVVGALLLRRHRAREWDKMPDERKGEESVI